MVMLETLYEDESLKVSLAPSNADTCIFVFVGVGWAGEQTPREEFVGWIEKNNWRGVFITDKQRSWYNGIEPDALLALLRPLRGKRNIGLGNSMGGFGAILFSGPLELDDVIAISYQYSIHPEVIPEDRRWREYSDQVSAYRYPSLAEAFVSKTRYLLLSAEHHLELLHATRVPQGDQITNILVPLLKHDLAPAFKEDGLLHDVMTLWINGGGPLAPLQEGYRAYLLNAKGKDYLHHLSAGFRLEKTDPQRAEANFRLALDCNPTSAVAAWRLARLLQASGKDQEGAETLARAKALQPRNMRQITGLANELLKGGDVAWAEELLRGALARDPQIRGPYKLLADLLAARGDLGEAEEIRARWLARRPAGS